MGGLRERVLAWLSRRPEAQGWALLAPGTLWLIAFFLVPILFIGFSAIGIVDPSELSGPDTIRPERPFGEFAA